MLKRAHSLLNQHCFLWAKGQLAMAKGREWQATVAAG